MTSNRKAALTPSSLTPSSAQNITKSPTTFVGNRRITRDTRRLSSHTNTIAHGVDDDSNWRRKPTTDKKNTTAYQSTKQQNEQWLKAFQLTLPLEENSGMSSSIDGNEIVKLLDTLLAVQYPEPSINNSTAKSVILSLSKHICLSDSVASKFCQLLTLLIARQKLSMSSGDHTKHLLESMLQLIKQSQSHVILVSALRTISFIIAIPGADISDDIALALFTSMLLRVTASDFNIKYYSLVCIEKISCMKPAILKSNLKELFDQLFHNLQLFSKLIESDSSVEKHVTLLLKLIISVVQTGNKIHVPVVSELVSMLKRLMFYGTTDYFPTPPTTRPTTEREKDRYVVTSGSDLSDSEQFAGSRSSIQIRLQVLQLLSEMAKQDFKSIFGEFKTLIADTDSTNPRPRDEPTLCTVVLYDRSARCRSMGAQVLHSMLDNSKLFLAQADDSKTKSAFVPFSRSLAYMINELHVTLITAIEKEKSSTTLLYFIKSLCTLINNTPYEKLSMKYMYRITTTMLRLIETCSERTTQNASFNCLALVLGTPRPLKEVEKFLCDTEPMAAFITYMEAPYSVLIRTEAAQVVLNLAKNYPSVVEKNWTNLCQVIHRGLSHSDQTLRLHLVQIVNNFTAPFLAMPPIITSSVQQIEAIIPDKLIKPIPKHIWTSIIDDIVSIAINDEFQSVRSAACLIYSNIDEDMFSELSIEHQTDAVDKLFEAIEDEAPSVRASACKAIGSFILFSTLREDVQFLDRTFTCLKKLLADQTQNVRVRSSWAIANLCDAARQASWCQNCDEPNTSSVRELISDLILTCLNTCEEVDKIACNSTRGLGNIGQIAPSFSLHTRVYHDDKHRLYIKMNDDDCSTSRVATTLEDAILTELVECIQSNDRSVKPRWNSCYALGCLLRNQHVSPTAIKQALDCLSETIKADKNFKVKIQAALAISMVDDYGVETGHVLNALLQPFLKSNSNYQYREYKYVKTLKEQVQNAICHLLSSVKDEHVELLRMEFETQSKTIAAIIADALNQPERYDESMRALQKSISILESLCSTVEETNKRDQIAQALDTLKKKLAFELQIQENSGVTLVKGTS